MDAATPASAGVGADRLVLDGVSKSFQDVVAVDGVSLQVRRGDVLALLGPSGCGKTTLLRLIAGLEDPDGGTIGFGDRVLCGAARNVRPDQRGVGMVFQDWALFPHLSVRANVAYGLDRGERKGPRPERALELVGLTGLGDRMPGQLSGGQQQRVALARVLVLRPSIVLLDEPFSNLDAALRQRIRGEVAGLLRELDVATVFVTHDQQEAFMLGDRVAVMRDGRVVQEGPPADVYERPLTPWVAAFVGEATLVPGEADGRHARTALGSVPIAAPASGRVEVLVRPEAVVLGATGVSATGEVLDHHYLGPVTTYRVRLADGTTVRVSEPGPARRDDGETLGVAYGGAPTSAWPADLGP